MSDCERSGARAWHSPFRGPRGPDADVPKAPPEEPAGTVPRTGSRFPKGPMSHRPAACTAALGLAASEGLPRSRWGGLGSPWVSCDAHTLSPTCPLSFPASLAAAGLSVFRASPCAWPAVSRRRAGRSRPGALGRLFPALNPARFPTSPSR